jgi:signal transduction histidine kinase
VVTHNVSVMVVQAGAARRVLGSSPGQTREAQTAIEALLAVEASGRIAMGELRHLLGLLAPSGEAPGGDDAALVPQPDVGQVRSLVERVRAAGLPVELTITGARALPPGVDLAAYRVVQEALTNVIKHASQARTAVRIEYRPHELLIDVADDGVAAGAGRLQPGGGRGLIGLRERIAIYGGDLDAGPRPGGGWRVQARIPLEAAGSVWPELPVTGIFGVNGTMPR